MPSLNPTEKQINAFQEFQILERKLRLSLADEIRDYTVDERQIVKQKETLWDQMSDEQRRCWANGPANTGGRHSIPTGVEPSQMKEWSCLTCNMTFPGGKSLDETKARDLTDEDFLQVAIHRVQLVPTASTMTMPSIGIGNHNPSTNGPEREE